MPYYVAMDVGCIECGEESSVLGIFTSKAAAEEALTEHQVRQKEDWHGQHSFEVHKIKELNAVERVEYK